MQCSHERLLDLSVGCGSHGLDECVDDCSIGNESTAAGLLLGEFMEDLGGLQHNCFVVVHQQLGNLRKNLRSELCRSLCVCVCVYSVSSHLYITQAQTLQDS